MSKTSGIFDPVMYVRAAPKLEVSTNTGSPRYVSVYCWRQERSNCNPPPRISLFGKSRGKRPSWGHQSSSAILFTKLFVSHNLHVSWTLHVQLFGVCKRAWLLSAAQFVPDGRRLAFGHATSQSQVERSSYTYVTTPRQGGRDFSSARLLELDWMCCQPDL
ncbi:hypothetical protein Bbelb_066820 [Branchiostoma belcheri]|nr:hypothetical protein Bbelb_066820 [Branchiostoma belcheri]